MDDDRRLMADIPCAGCGANISSELDSYRTTYTHELLNYYYCSSECQERGKWKRPAVRDPFDSVSLSTDAKGRGA